MTALKPYAPGAVNRMLDPSAESGVSGMWATNNATLYVATLDTTVKDSGTRSLKTVRAASSPSVQLSGVTTAPSAVGNALRVLVTGGEVVSLGLKVRTDSTLKPNARLTLTWRDASGAAVGGNVGGPLTAVNAANVWQPVLFEGAVAPAGTTYVQVIATLNTASGNSVGGEQVWWDSQVITTGARAEPYFDGSMPGCSWSGTPWQSQSVRAVVTPWSRWDGIAEQPLDVAGQWDGAALHPIDLRDVTVV